MDRKKVLSHSDITQLCDTAKKIVSLTDEITKLENRKKHFEGMAPFISIDFQYEHLTYGAEIDLTIDVNLGSPDPLRDIWLNFQKQAIVALDEAILIKKGMLAEIRDSLKK